ncbi:MAG: hypothetical protein KC503_20865, partial [Myxococcales bacterium]|nr:hypothetical protein [Myxococcales bacterium]
LVVALLGVAAASASAAARAEPSVRQRAETYAQQHNRAAISQALSRRARGRPVITLPGKQQVRSYCEAFKHDTIEIIFRPHASEWGHIHLRAGDTVYDLGGSRFARADKLPDASSVVRGAAYGFVFGMSRETISQLKRQLDDKVRKAKSGELRFSYKPWQEQGHSCETFITSTLRELTPALGVYRSGFRGATGLGKWGLSSDKLEAITLYGASSDKATRERFAFDKLDGR